MADREVKTDGSQSLADFQSVVQQQEGIYGPLVSLRSNQGFNFMGFDVGESPTNRAVLETFDGDNPPDKSGHSTVCSGDCLVSGNPEKVAAYRKN